MIYRLLNYKYLMLATLFTRFKVVIFVDVIYEGWFIDKIYLS